MQLVMYGIGMGIDGIDAIGRVAKNENNYIKYYIILGFKSFFLLGGCQANTLLALAALRFEAVQGHSQNAQNRLHTPFPTAKTSFLKHLSSHTSLQTWPSR